MPDYSSKVLKSALPVILILELSGALRVNGWPHPGTNWYQNGQKKLSFTQLMLTPTMTS